MSGPKHARKTWTTKGRTYQHPRTGETAWSVTTIIDGGLPKKQLVGWAAREVAEFAVANHGVIETMLAGVRLVPEIDVEIGPRGGRKETRTYTHRISDPDAVAAAVDYLKGSPYRSRDRKADIGTLVHQYVEAVILGTPMPEVPPDAAAHMAQFDAFVRRFEPEFIAAETTIWNRTEAYAGTLDWIARIGGRTLLVDTKTGKDIYSDVALQLAALGHGEFVLMADGSEEPLPEVEGYAALHLTADGAWLRPVHVTERTWDTFRYVREVFRWDSELSQDAVSAAWEGPDGIAWTFGQREAA